LLAVGPGGGPSDSADQRSAEMDMKPVRNRMISSDTHVFEPPRLWLDRLDKKYEDRAPHVIRTNNIDVWYCDGQRFMSAGAGTQTGKRYEGRFNVRAEGHMEDVPKGAYIPEEAVKDMASDGVDVGVIYPTVALNIYTLPDTALVNVLFAAYNDWMAEFCHAAPDQLKGIALINLDMDDVTLAVRELARCAKMGLSGALISVYPGEARAYSRPEYDPFWAAAEDLRMVIGLHTSTNRVLHEGSLFDYSQTTPATHSNADHWVRQSLGHMIFSGVFERHPKLYVGAVEYEMAWVPHFLDRMDFNYNNRAGLITHFFRDGAAPSDFFRSNCFVGFNEDPIGVEFRKYIGIDNITWGSDYPHPESTFPRSQEVLKEMFKTCTEEEVVKMTYSNAARIFGIT
jgi:predicted TIM-barrel fold metal-dependent hydrolase